LERLLDVFWLLLFAPSLCLWLRRRSDLRFAQFLLAASCSLILLFPVISASDDLRALRQEIDEPAPSKRDVKQVSGTKHHVPLTPILVFAGQEIPTLEWMGELTPTSDQTRISSNALQSRSSRAPPKFHA
jgi:hypothetical protein